MKTLHLVCNAHLDPVWLWDLEEGAAAAISTFRSAVTLAEEFDYIFCHNEALLYRWIEEHDSPLFARIQALANAGKWRVMGGWFLQPDCDMLSGESLVRQIMEGRTYFQEKFNQRPTTAVNVDSFGHCSGLPQILRSCGYDSYMICRPSPWQDNLPEKFIWEGPDGSTVKVYRGDSYGSSMGEAAERIRNELEARKDCETAVLFWGVGNHGGGPSRKDLTDIATLIKSSETSIVHSFPEAYMETFPTDLPVIRRPLRCLPGCYTSMVRVKQHHRQLESTLYQAEKMCTAASIQLGMHYPAEEFSEAQRALMTTEFHDILSGTSVADGEQTGLRLLNYGLEIANRMRTRAMFALSAAEAPALPGEYPILVYNSQPYPVNAVVEVPLVLARQNWSSTYTDLQVSCNGEPLPTQVLKEHSNITLDWAKRVTFLCTLAPMSMNRFDCKEIVLPEKPSLPTVDGDICFKNAHICARISAQTGMLESYTVDGMSFIQEGTQLVLYKDNPDPWGFDPQQNLRLAQPEETFRLMTEAEAGRYCGSTAPVPPIRIVEDGNVLTEVESLLICRDTPIRVNWRLYKDASDLDVSIDMLYAGKDSLIKWHLPLAFAGTACAQTAFGVEQVPANGREMVSLDWVGYRNQAQMFAVLRRGSYGWDMIDQEMHLTLVRSPAYAALPLGDRPIIRSDRYIPRMDQGQHTFHFRLVGGAYDQVEAVLDRKSQQFNEQTFSLQMFPAANRALQEKRLLSLDNEAIIMSALKASSAGGYVIRLYNSLAREQVCTLTISQPACSKSLSFRPFQVLTLRITENAVELCQEMEI